MEVALWWSLWMLLFVAVNAHAVWTSVRTLWREQRAAQSRRQRKRPRGDDLDLDLERGGGAGRSARCAVVWTRVASEERRKRRRLGGWHVVGTPSRRRGACAWPWPRELWLSVAALGTGSEDWLARHPLVADAAARLRDVAQSALQEVLVSCVSFALCSLAVLLLRRYSTLVVGVSVDLGAFSLEV